LLDRRHDRVDNAGGISQHVIIPEPHHAKPLIFEPSRSRICFAVGVLTTIHFDDESLKANEVDDVFSDRCLSFEFRSFKAMNSQEIPKPALGFGYVAS
jgi:hypothetical protein